MDSSLVRTVGKLFAVFRLVWMERLVYRVNLFLEILSGIFSSLIIVFLWMAVYRNRSQTVLGDYTLAEMVTYLIGGGLIASFVQTAADLQETSLSIQDGSLSNLLLKPIHPYGIWFVRDLAGKSFFLLLGLCGYLAVLLFFREYVVPPASALHLLLALVGTGMAALLQFLLFEALSLLAFWIERTYGILFIMRVIMEVLGGAIIPLSFFPEALREVFLNLPFSFLIYLPMALYLGKIPLQDVPWQFLREIGWIAFLAVLNVCIWKKGIRQYVAMGD
ncbi:MAG: ABC-2 family transporter protein [bacterium]